MPETRNNTKLSALKIPLQIYKKYTLVCILIYLQQDETLHSLFISGKFLYMFRVLSPPIIRSTHNYIYSIWYFSKCYCYLPLLWKSWNWSECGVGIVLISTIPAPHSDPFHFFQNSGR